MGTACCAASDTILSRWLSKNGSAGTTRPPASSFPREAKTSSKSCSVLALSTGIWIPSARGRRRFLHVNLGAWAGRVYEKRNHSRRGHCFFQKLRGLRYQFRVQKAHAGNVATRPIEAGNETQSNGVADRRKNDGNRRSRFLGRKGRRRAACRKEHRHSQVNEFSRQRRQSIIVTFRPAKRDRQILTFDKPRFAEASTEGFHNTCRFPWRATADEPNHRHCLLLRPRRERPCRRAAEQRDELAPFHIRGHSITSSALASSCGGTSRPSALAVCRLMTNSNLVDCTTGRSAGFAPLRIRPVYTPTWRYMSSRSVP